MIPKRDMVHLLQRLEWVSGNIWGGSLAEICPSCRRFKCDGHNPTCQLAIAIADLNLDIFRAEKSLKDAHLGKGKT